MFLPDVNLWLALAFDGHVHHLPAATWYRGLSGPCFFYRVTQTGFLRLATNPKAFPDDAVSMSEAWDLYDAMLNDPKPPISEGSLVVKKATYRTMDGKVAVDRRRDGAKY